MEHVRVSKRILQFPTATPTPADNLTVHNPTTTAIAFKVKTTNQTRYIVRPNVGIIPPNDSTTIIITLQTTEPLPPGLSKDKFLLRTTQAPGFTELPPEFWHIRESDPAVFGIKFKVEFIDDGEDANGVGQVIDVDELLLEDRYEQAVAKVKELHQILDAKNLELTKLRTELAETKAETERVLKEAPKTPITANKVLSDPFGGVSVAGFGLMLLLFLVLVNVILRII